jgi:hypothetical protein
VTAVVLFLSTSGEERERECGVVVYIVYLRVPKIAANTLNLFLFMW